MDNLSIFDIAGPIMVGPSSSHTAGACKIGQFARALFNTTPEKVTFYLHGSFAEVYQGHATDKALLGGILKFKTSDPNIARSFEIAKEKGLKYDFKIINLGAKAHPNTVKIVLKKGKNKMEVTGSSVGGGIIEILKINNFDIHLKGRAGKYLSLVVHHEKKRSILNQIEKKLKGWGIGISNLQSRSLGNKSISVIGMDGPRIKVPQVLELEKIPGIEFVRSLSKLEKQ
ncbi:L-serine ammonia-lyase, iron-sulfur-dependent subunit beta [Patescibacteria group bacterium]